MTLYKKEDGIFLQDETILQLSDVDSIIFDCDGVLIDITRSYDLTIQKTVDYVLTTMTEIDSISVSHKIIDAFKATGGFNDEVDLAYGVILSVYAASQLGQDKSEFIFDVISHATKDGISSVEKYLGSLTDISKIKTKLDYPGPHETNPLYVIFDQLFYGPELYATLYGRSSKFSESGLINNDDVIVTKSLLDTLAKKFGKNIAIVTGRGIDSTKYSLKDLFNRFNVDCSMFLEDEPRDLAKPNPQSLTQTISKLSSKKTLYVGDSVEDLLMANAATKLGKPTMFCGIIGTSKDPENKLKLFSEKNVNLVLDSITLIPKVLNLE